MTTYVGDVVSNTLQRVRDLQGAGHTREFTRTILTHSQRIVNSVTGAVVVENALTLQPRRLVYNIKALLSNSIRVLGVRFQNHDLLRTTPEDLRGYDPDWPRRVSSGPNSFAEYGRNILVLYPGTEETGTVTVVSAKDTGVIDSDTDTMAVPDHLVPLVTDLAEIILLLRQRDFDVARRQFPSLTKRFEEYQVV